MVSGSKKKIAEATDAELIQTYEIEQGRVEEYIVMDENLFPILITASKCDAEILVRQAEKYGRRAYIAVAERGENEDYIQDIEID